MAEVLGLQQQELASLAGVHRNTLRLHPDSSQVQAMLRNLARVPTAMSQIQPDVVTPVYHIKNTPIPAFDYSTLLEVIAAGRVDDALLEGGRGSGPREVILRLPETRRDRGGE